MLSSPAGERSRACDAAVRDLAGDARCRGCRRPPVMHNPSAFVRGRQEADNVAKIGEAKCKLYLVGAQPDWKGRTIKNVSSPTLSSPFKLVLSKTRSSCAAMFWSLLQRHLDKIKEEDVTSIYSTKASLHLVQQAMATPILLGIFQSSKVTEMYADTHLLDGTAFFEKIDMNHVERHQKITKGYES